MAQLARLWSGGLGAQHKLYAGLVFSAKSVEFSYFRGPWPLFSSLAAHANASPRRLRGGRRACNYKTGWKFGVPP